MASIRKRLNHFQMLCKANMQKNDWIKWFIILFTLFPGVRLEDHLRSNICNNHKTLCDVTSWVLALRPSPSWNFKAEEIIFGQKQWSQGRYPDCICLRTRRHTVVAICQSQGSLCLFYRLFYFNCVTIIYK